MAGGVCEAEVYKECTEHQTLVLFQPTQSRLQCPQIFAMEWRASLGLDFMLHVEGKLLAGHFQLKQADVYGVGYFSIFLVSAREAAELIFQNNSDLRRKSVPIFTRDTSS